MKRKKIMANDSSQYANEDTIKDMLCFYTQFMEFLDASFIYTKMMKTKDVNS